MKRNRVITVALALAAGMLASGCASQQPIKPWERGALAGAEMAWEPDPLLAGYRRHTQYSKEGASGGPTLGGGGCGCN